MDAEGDTPTEAAIELYEPLTFDEFDTECGTFGSAEYAPEDGKLVPCASLLTLT